MRAMIIGENVLDKDKLVGFALRSAARPLVPTASAPASERPFSRSAIAADRDGSVRVGILSSASGRAK
jgi:hypothetical protein